MGDNYYLHRSVCKHCGRSDKPLHIGKASGGWTFSFRGYRNEWDEVRVRSYADWLRVLEEATSKGDQIRDEYGTAVTLGEFMRLVEAKRGSRLNHTTYCEAHHPQHAASDCWLDEEGNSFSSAEFS